MSHWVSARGAEREETGEGWARALREEVILAAQWPLHPCGAALQPALPVPTLHCSSEALALGNSSPNRTLIMPAPHCPLCEPFPLSHWPTRTQEEVIKAAGGGAALQGPLSTQRSTGQHGRACKHTSLEHSAKRSPNGGQWRMYEAGLQTQRVQIQPASSHDSLNWLIEQLLRLKSSKM